LDISIIFSHTESAMSIICLIGTANT